MESNTTGTTCLGPLAGLQAQQQLYQDTVSALGDGDITTLVLVTRPEVTALREAARTSAELAALGFHVMDDPFDQELLTRWIQLNRTPAQPVKRPRWWKVDGSDEW